MPIIKLGFSSILTILSLYVCCAHMELLRTKYVLTRVCRADFGQWLADVSGVVTSSACSVLCATDAVCVSFLFETGRCQLNAEEAPPLSTNCSMKIVYGFIEKATSRQHWLHQPCGSMCPVPNSRCYGNMCTCKDGYSYHRKSDSCVEDCSLYGRSFTYQVSALTGFDAAVYPSQTFAQCYVLCIAATSFLCRSVELIPDVEPQTCYLVTETILTQPAAINVLGPQHTYRRNCA